MKYVEGDLLDMALHNKFDIIVHGANCQNTMNSGIAKQIREQFPKAYLADQLTQKGDARKLGCFTQAFIQEKSKGFTILNAYTQHQYGYDNKVYANYGAIEQAFTQIKLLYDMNPMAITRIGIPKIGSGLAGGDWAIIERIIDKLNFSDLTCVIYTK